MRCDGNYGRTIGGTHCAIRNCKFYTIKIYISEINIQRCVNQVFILVEQISGKIWHNRGFNDKSVKTSKIVHLDLLNKIGYGPIA